MDKPPLYTAPQAPMFSPKGGPDTPKKARGRRRWKAGLKLFLRLVLVGGALLGVVWGGLWVWTYFMEVNKSFSLEEVHLQTNGSLKTEEVKAILGLDEQKNILLLDINKCRETLLARSDIAEATIYRELPNVLVIDLVERVPMAWLEYPVGKVYATKQKGGWMVDSTGYIFASVDGQKQAYKDLPVLELPPSLLADYVLGQSINNDAVKRSLSFLRVSKDFIPLGLPMILHVSFPNEWSMLARFSNGMEITFGLFEPERQLNQLLTILHYAETTGRHVKSAHLLLKKNIPVVLGDGEKDQVFAVEILGEEEQEAPALGGKVGSEGDSVPSEVGGAVIIEEEEESVELPPATPAPQKANSPPSSSLKGKESSVTSPKDEPQKAPTPKKRVEKPTSARPEVSKEKPQRVSSPPASTSKPKPSPKPSPKQSPKPQVKQPEAPKPSAPAPVRRQAPSPQPQQPKPAAPSTAPVPSFNW